MNNVVKHVTGLPFQFGGEEHSGWLPRGAAKPLPTPIENVMLDIEIVSEGSGYLLCWNAREGKRSGDWWFKTLSEAEVAATEYFGITRNQWKQGASEPDIAHVDGI
jgi:hypothetical protein